MQIYNITFIVESVIEQKWATYVDKELLPQISINVHQIDLLKGDYKQTMKVLRGYIKELEKKIDTLTSLKTQMPTKKVENNDTSSENIVLEINETK